MSIEITVSPCSQFFDLTGAPLEGSVYYGEPNQDPQQFPIAVYWDAAGLVPAVQPIRTISGYLSRNGTPANIYIDGDYSVRARNSAGSQVFYAPRITAQFEGQVWVTGADTSGGVSAVAAFQAAIDSTPNSGVQVIHVARGTYLGDMTTLNNGLRTVVWAEEGGVTYITAAPEAVTGVVRTNSTYSGDTTRPWYVGKNGFASDSTDGLSTDRPTLRVVRDANHTGGTSGGTVNSSSLSVQNNVGAGPENYENAIVAQVVSELSHNGPSPNLTVVQGVLLKNEASTGGFFGANFVARDQTTLGTANSRGSLIGCEVDVVASGPDTTNRIIVDAIARGYDASADGATSVYCGVRVRPANSGVISAEPVNIDYAYISDVGSLGSIDTHYYAEGDCSTPAGAHFEAFSDTAVQGIVKIGSKRNTAAQVTGQLVFTGRNNVSTKTNYAQLLCTIIDPTDTSEDSELSFRTLVAGATTNEMTLRGGMIVGAPIGSFKGVGSINVEVDIYKNNTAYTNPDYVFEKHYTGDITLFADKPGAENYHGLRSIDEIYEHTKNTFRLPGFNDAPMGMFERADLLLEKLEEAYLLIFQLNDKNKQLEARIAALESK